MNARLKLLHEKANVKQVKLLPTTVVGRSTECDLKIASSQVSRRHCQITVTEEAVYVEDLGSANGTFVNDQMLPPRKPTAVQPGAKISIGPAEFLVDYIAPSSNTVVVRRSATGAKPPAEEVNVEADSSEKDFVFTAAVEEPASESEATFYGERMENLVAAAMEAIQPVIPAKSPEPQPAPPPAAAIKQPPAVVPVLNPEPTPTAEPVAAMLPIAVSPPVSVVAVPPTEPAPVPQPVRATSAVAVATPVPAASVATAVPAKPAVAAVAAPVKAPVAAVAVPVKPVAVAAAAPVAKAVAVPTARAVPVPPPAPAVAARVEPAVSEPENPFQFGFDAPVKAAPAKAASAKATPAKPVGKSPTPPAKPVPVAAAPAAPVIAAPPIAAPQVFEEPQPFAQFGEPTESQSGDDDAMGFDFSADSSPAPAAKPAAKSGKAAAGGLKSLFSVFGKKTGKPAAKETAEAPQSEEVEEQPEPVETPSEETAEEVEQPAAFAFGATDAAAEVEEVSHDQSAPDDDFQNFLKQF